MIVLDTHIFIWMHLDPEKIPHAIAEAMAESSTLGLAAISLWEIALLQERNRIALPDELLSWLSVILK